MKKIKKAVILAAGFGTRLKPITDSTPKCLVDINGTPLLGWWLKLLEKYGIEEALINTHYLSEKVDEYIKNEYDGKIKVSLSYEPILLGSAGTIRSNYSFFCDENDFLIVYADNLTDVDLEKMMKTHYSNHSCFTCGVFHTNRPKECGILAVNEDGVVVEFEEKPEFPKSNLANAGIYIVNQQAYPDFMKENCFDIGKDVLPAFVNRMIAYEIKEYLLDIGTIENLSKARREWKYDNF